MGVKQPNSRRNLDMAIRRMGEGDSDYLRNRTLLANVIVAQLMPNGAVKGGSSLRIRFGGADTRATTDLDAARASMLDEFVADFAENLAAGWCGFTGRLLKKEPAKPVGVPQPYVMQPCEAKLSYLGSAWCTVDFELGHDEIGDANDPDMVVPVEASRLLTALGFPEPSPLPLLPLPYQIAQKLHGASEPGSNRAHDLIDLQIIVNKGDVDYGATREVCVRLFSYRRAQAWPPVITENDGWADIYEEQRKDLSVIPDVSAAVRWANELIAHINES